MDSIKRKHHKYMFSKQEDDLLRSLVAEYGDKDWDLISSFIKGRNRRQCRERWKKFLCPSLNNSPWTQEEDDLLKSKVAAFGHKWKFFTQFFVGRTDINIKNRYNFLKKKEMKMLKNKINKATEVSFEEEKMGEKEKETNKESMMDFLPDSIFGCIDNDSPC